MPVGAIMSEVDDVEGYIGSALSSPSQYGYTIWGGQMDMPQEDSRDL